MRTTLFRKADIFLIGAVASAAVFLLVLYVRQMSCLRTPELEILVDSRIYGTYSLSEDQEIRIGETCVCTIENGRVMMKTADCPDQVCVHTKAIDKNGGSIVCLPNKVILHIIEASDGGEVDTVAG